MRLSAWTALSSSLVVISAALVILVATNSLVRDQLQADASMRLEAQLDKEVTLLRARLNAVGANMAAIAQGPVLQALLDTDRAKREGLEQQVDAELSSMMAAHQNYIQLRFLDITGHERARVDRQDGKIVIRPQAGLQDKSKRDYVPPILALQRGEIYVSRLDLNREHGVIERPLRPTLRIAAPVFDGTGERRGAVLANLDAQTLLPPRELGGAHFLLLDENGAFLRHPDPAQEFGLELGSGVTMWRDHGDTAAQLDRRTAGVEHLSSGLINGEPELIAFRQIADGPSEPAHHWLMIVAQPQSVAFAPIQSLSDDLMRIVLGVAMLACAFGWLLAYRVTRPLKQITEVAKRITSGDLQSETEVPGDGEIAQLGAAFNLMTTRLRQMIDDERRTSQELGRLNLELQKSNLELQRSNQDLADFAHAASHDLRTPLRALRVLPSWIQDDLEGVDLPEDVQEHLETMEAQGERMENVISGLLEYSRIGKQEGRLQSFAPRAVAEDILSLLMIPERFTVELDVEPQEITAVVAEFELILRNLVQNAIAHHDRDHGALRISGGTRDHEFILEVGDDGPGIPPEFHKRVLLPFHSLKRRDEGGGSGLGLALINKIVQRSGGSLEIQSETGVRGTRFRVALPIQISAPPGPRDRSTATVSAQAA